ncbi:hypothetical protein DDZ18_04525 [Marinicauda salina]|uniref:Uncharacterized protein n=1 Tax=Marinicauda salina TaxID=2135793 RepID=A0A2U2BXZ9_9PROT|nr:hypothetical protein DDZ18_04525 [Marinicauda salina]
MRGGRPVETGLVRHQSGEFRSRGEFMGVGGRTLARDRGGFGETPLGIGRPRAIDAGRVRKSRSGGDDQ